MGTMGGSELLEETEDKATIYLREVMGIVEEDEFTDDQKKTKRQAKKTEEELAVKEGAGCCTKIIFFLILSLFLTSSMVAASNYKDSDSLGIRRLVLEDPLGVRSFTSLGTELGITAREALLDAAERLNQLSDCFNVRLEKVKKDLVT